MRRAAILALASLGAACGVRAPPRPPLPEAAAADAGPPLGAHCLAPGCFPPPGADGGEPGDAGAPADGGSP